MVCDVQKVGVDKETSWRRLVYGMAAIFALTALAVASGVKAEEMYESCDITIKNLSDKQTLQPGVWTMSEDRNVLYAEGRPPSEMMRKLAAGDPAMALAAGAMPIDAIPPGETVSFSCGDSAMHGKDYLSFVSGLDHVKEYGVEFVGVTNVLMHTEKKEPITAEWELLVHYFEGEDGVIRENDMYHADKPMAQLTVRCKLVKK